MTFAEFEETYNNCDICPIRLAGYCQMVPDYEPPCSFADPNQQMEDWINKKDEQISRYEEWQDQQTQEAKKRKEIAKKKAETARQMKDYCFSELYEVRRLKRQLKKATALKETIQAQIEATNSINEMFHHPERVKMPAEIQEQLELMSVRLIEAEEAYRLKKKEFYTKRKIRNDTI